MITQITFLIEAAPMFIEFVLKFPSWRTNDTHSLCRTEGSTSSTPAFCQTRRSKQHNGSKPAEIEPRYSGYTSASREVLCRASNRRSSEEPVSLRCKDREREKMQKHYIEIAKYFQKMFPLNSQMLRDLSCLHPEMYMKTATVCSIELFAKHVPHVICWRLVPARSSWWRWKVNK